MTDTPKDLTPEAVERLASMVERHQNRKAKKHAANPRYSQPDDRYDPIPDTLRALSAALAEKNDALTRATLRADVAEARAEALAAYCASLANLEGDKL